MSTTKPPSERRLAANRANAQKSTGPRTPEGKAASSRNAVKHGFTASSFSVVRLEDLQEIAKLKADAVACYKPVNAQELFAVERIALAQMQILRGARLEAGLFTAAFNLAIDPDEGNPIIPMHEHVVGDIEITRQQNRNYALGEGFRKMTEKSDAWVLLLRYQAKAERDYRRAIEDFERLKALRTEMPNEPNIGAQPAEPEDLATIEELNYRLAGSLRYEERRNRKPASPVTPPVSIPRELPQRDPNPE
jgi:hypothetical protein